MLNSVKGKLGAFFYSIPFAAWLTLFALGGGIIGFGGYTFNYAAGYYWDMNTMMSQVPKWWIEAIAKHSAAEFGGVTGRSRRAHSP